MSFSSDLSSFGSKTSIKLDKIVRKVVIDITSEIVKATPVDTGAARSNWFWGNQQVTSTARTIDKSGTPSTSRAVAFSARVKVGGVFYLTNNLPYIMALEYGHSQRQAPFGMARITVARWQGIVNRAVSAL
jgi:hypothetical protein